MPTQKVGEFTYSLQMMLHEIHLIIAKLRHCFQAHFREHSLNDSCGDLRRRLGAVSGPAIIEASDGLIVGEFDHRQEKLHGRVIQEQCC